MSLYVNFSKGIEAVLLSPWDEEKLERTSLGVFDMFSHKPSNWIARRENTTLIVLCDLGGPIKYVG